MLTITRDVLCSAPMIVSFYVSGEPRPQPRPRAFARKMGDHYVARVYDAATAEGWKSAIAVAAKEAGIVRFDGPVELDLRFNFKRPKAHFNSRGQLKATAPCWYMPKGRNDFENLAKSVADALTIIGMWGDDSQVVRSIITKDWAIGSSSGGCHITITGL